MTMKYEEYEFIEALEVIPVDGSEGHGIKRIYTVEQHEMSLVLPVFPYDGDVYISLYQHGSERPIFYCPIRKCEGYRSVKDPTGTECLEFQITQDGTGSVLFIAIFY